MLMRRSPSSLASSGGEGYGGGGRAGDGEWHTVARRGRRAPSPAESEGQVCAYLYFEFFYVFWGRWRVRYFGDNEELDHSKSWTTRIRKTYDAGSTGAALLLFFRFQSPRDWISAQRDRSGRVWCF